MSIKISEIYRHREGDYEAHAISPERKAGNHVANGPVHVEAD